VTLESCRALEASGQVDAAYRGYLAEGHVDDAARLLVAHGKGAEAADLLLSSATRAPRPFDATTSARIRTAIGLLEAQGQTSRCLQALAWFGDQTLLNDTAERLAGAGHTYDAGVTLARHGDPARAVALLTKLPRDDERYAGACIEVIRALVRGATLTMGIDRFLAGFIRRGPGDDATADAFYALAAVYAKHALPENALEVLERLCAQRPDYKDAARQRRRLEEQVLGSTEELARVLDEDAAFEAAVKRTIPPPAPAVPAAVPASVTGVSAPPTKPPSREGPAEAARVAADAAVAAATVAADDELEATTLSFAPGTTVARRYSIVGVLGRGGMSIVYEAKDLELNETVALKLFTQPTNEEAIERFKQEIKLARQLIHDNIIRVYDLGTALGARFLTMELLVGEDLHAKMTRGISLREGCNLLAQACDGLDAAHRIGVVHRDIKPENLFVTKSGVVKVMDFGIAKQMRQPGLTMAGMVVGTPEYMAPEQAHGHMAVTPAADLYSIGIILYALSTGQLPFRHDELVPLLLMHVGEAPRPPRQLNPGCPVEVEQLILELLSKQAEQRPPSAAAVAERLRKLRTDGII
jgi:serine/threonine-protein kinase